MIGDKDADVILIVAQYAANQVNLQHLEFEEVVDSLVLNLEKYEVRRDDIARELELAVAAPSMDELNNTMKAKLVST